MSQDDKRMINNRDRAQSERLADDKGMMDAVLKTNKEGWTKLTNTTWQYVRPSGNGFITFIMGNWKWMANPNGQPRVEGSCKLIESAMQAVQNEINV